MVRLLKIGLLIRSTLFPSLRVQYRIQVALVTT